MFDAPPIMYLNGKRRSHIYCCTMRGRPHAKHAANKKRMQGLFVCIRGAQTEKTDTRDGGPDG